MKKISLIFVLSLITILSKAQITTTPSHLSFATPVGVESASQYFYVSVTTIDTQHLTITAPNGFRVSFDDTSWASSISTHLAAGVTLGIQVYVDFIPLDSSCYSNGLILSVGGLPIKNYPLWGNSICPYISGYPSDSLTVFIDEFCSGPKLTIATNYYIGPQTVKTYYGDGTTDTASLHPGYGYTSGIAIFNHVYNLPGTYTLKTVLFTGSLAVDSITYSYEYKFCNTIPVKYYFDVNNNCSYDNNVDYFVSAPLLTEVDSNGIAVDTISSASGFYYNAYGSPGDVYLFKTISYIPALTTSCPVSGIITDTLKALTYNIATNYIGMTCSSFPSFDLSVIDIIPVTGEYDQWGNIYVQNLSSCDSSTSPDATVTLHFSPKYQHLGSSGNTISWDLPGLSTKGTIIDLYYAIYAESSYPVPGDTVQTYVTIAPTVGDVNPGNNTEMVIDTVRAGCDPNEMWVSPNRCLAPTTGSTQLKYTISFVNTGNDTAFNIYILDTLSSNVDISTMRVIMTSANMNIYNFKDSAGQNILKFDFPGINLLDSSHHSQCSATVIFTINTKPALPDSTTIDNEAGIYFDYNAVVMTNMVENKVGCPSGIPILLNTQSLSIYPNPATNELTVKTNAFSSFTISDMIGQHITSQNITGAVTTVNIQLLPAGVYYITFRGAGGSVVEKFVKE